MTDNEKCLERPTPQLKLVEGPPLEEQVGELFNRMADLLGIVHQLEHQSQMTAKILLAHGHLPSGAVAVDPRALP